MITKILKWGNSLGLRIPKSFAKQAGVEEGSHVDISINGDQLVVRLVRSSRSSLRELLAQVSVDNIHDEIQTGDRIGREIW